MLESSSHPDYEAQLTCMIQGVSVVLGAGWSMTYAKVYDSLRKAPRKKRAQGVFKQIRVNNLGVSLG